MSFSSALKRLTFRSYPRCETLQLQRRYCHSQSFSSIESAVFQAVKDGEVSPKSTLLLCVSAGSDSMALLHLLQKVKTKALPELDLRVINFNHKARKESEDEAIFIGEWCNAYKLPYCIREFPNDQINVKANFQERARNWRKSESQLVLNGIDNVNGKYIVTAHHKDDQMETILMKLIRGSHITNLSAMKVKQGNLLKPLLSLSKLDLVQYLTSNNYTWHEDSSNSKTIYKRNKVRLELVPLLEELAGGKQALERRLTFLAKQSTEVSQLLQSMEEAKDGSSNIASTKYLEDYYYSLELHQSERKQMSPLQLSYKIHKWVQRLLGQSLHAELMDEIIASFDKLKDRKSVSTTISGDWDIVCFVDELRLVPRFYKPILQTTTIPLVEASAHLSITHPSFVKISHQNSFKMQLIESIVKQGLMCRLVGDGDFLWKRGKNGALKKSNIRDLFRKLPASERDRVLVLLDHENQVIAAIAGKTLIEDEKVLSNVTEDLVQVQLSIALKYLDI